MREYYDAETARQRIKGIINGSIKSDIELDDIYSQIDNAIVNGDYQIQFNYPIYRQTVDFLDKRGYRIEQIVSSRDNPTGSTIISWK